MAITSSRENRPTLPPLHTLALPGIHHFDAMHDSNSQRYSRPRSGRPQPFQRQYSISSSTSSRTPSPTPSDSSSESSSSSMPYTPLTPASACASRSKMRLIPSTLEEADAVVVVPPQSVYDESNPASLLDANANKSKALLLVGPALRHLRHPQRQIAKGARIHPYKIERTSSAPMPKHSRKQTPPKQDGYFAYTPSYNGQRRTSTSSTSTDVSAEVDLDVAEDVKMLSL
ncbi:hypothetical protein D9758_002438 [Tetrapyrgos nigripes]|uniref:Uncharacterized protein n=1 Tax=Tetrapyrgos nigripes TaxID=182062 RepID=A0A8H5GPJ1_9AGAR|nr:hypothetical protein D9758_002438 [Tetrapyrgos nigripes]